MPLTENPWPLPVTSIDNFSYADLDITAALEDIASRFIFNIPEWERNSMERVGFQVESAHWYYEDFVREQNPRFPTCSLKRFFAMLWENVPLLNEWHEMHEEAFDRFIAYKGFVPVCGAIILNSDCDKVVLVKGWKNSAGWGFPKGKINQNEESIECAIREVLEETGFDIKPLVSEERVIKVSIYTQMITLYIIHPVSEDVEFATRTRKEISRIEWFRLADLPGWGRVRVPGKFFLITPFMQSLKSWVSQRKRETQLENAKEIEVANQPVNGSNQPVNGSGSQATIQTSKKGKKGKDKKSLRQNNRSISQTRSIDFNSGSQNEASMTPDEHPTSFYSNTTGNISLLDLIASAGANLSSGPSSGNLTGTFPKATAVASPEQVHATTSYSSSPFQAYDPESTSPYQQRHRQYGRSNSRSSLSSSTSSVSISPVEIKQENEKKALELLNMFADDATRQTPNLSSTEQTPKPKHVKMPFSVYNTPPVPPVPQANEPDGSALMAALRSQAANPNKEQQFSPTNTASSVSPLRINTFNTMHSGVGIQPNYQALPLSGMNASRTIVPQTQIHQYAPIPMRADINPSLNHPVQSHPYRPSSVPLHEFADSYSTPVYHTLSPNHESTPRAPYLATPSDLYGPRVPPTTTSAPRNVPHAQQLLALFQDSSLSNGDSAFSQH